ncbi:MAG: glutathione S-transferase family protein [Candidatus Binatia bacterium]
MLGTVMIRLYEYPPSSNCQKVRLVLAEKNLTYETALIDLRQKQQKSPDYLRINPYGLVPAMEDEGTVLYESTIINEYLEERYPTPPLLPHHPAARARARLLEDFRDNHFYPALKPLMAETRRKEKNKWDWEAIRVEFKKVAPFFQRLEEELGRKEFLVGDYSIADIAFTPNLARLVELELGLPENFPLIRVWIKRLMARPSYQSIAQYVKAV